MSGPPPDNFARRSMHKLSTTKERSPPLPLIDGREGKAAPIHSEIYHSPPAGAFLVTQPFRNFLNA